MSRQMVLHEHRLSVLELSPDDLRHLLQLVPNYGVRPVPESPNTYEVTPNQQVGVIALPGVVLEVRPKLPIENVCFLISYALDQATWQDAAARYGAVDSIYEIVVPMFCRLVANATYKGLLHGYTQHEEALLSVRGQIRFGDQIRNRYGIAVPIEVRYDDFTPDILENQLLLAALVRLRQLPLRSIAVRRALREITFAFDGVSVPSFDPRRLPDLSYSRLNEHYREAIALARLILQSTSVNQGTNGTTASCFLIDMNDVFERFVYNALRESLGIPHREFQRGSPIALDTVGHVKMYPDLGWVRHGRFRFVGDVKYKRTTGASAGKNPDLYQLLAYLIATGLPEGMLIYGEGAPGRHVVARSGHVLDVRILDLTRSPSELLGSVREIAHALVARADTGHLFQRTVFGSNPNRRRR